MDLPGSGAGQGPGARYQGRGNCQESIGPASERGLGPEVGASGLVYKPLRAHSGLDIAFVPFSDLTKLMSGYHLPHL